MCRVSGQVRKKESRGKVSSRTLSTRVAEGELMLGEKEEDGLGSLEAVKSGELARRDSDLHEEIRAAGINQKFIATSFRVS